MALVYHGNKEKFEVFVVN